MPAAVSAPEPAERSARSSAALVTAASAFSAVAGFVVLFIVARSLSLADNAEFLAFWALLFGVFAVLGGIQAASTRAISVARLAPAELRTGARPAPVAAVLGVVVGAGGALLAVVSGIVNHSPGPMTALGALIVGLAAVLYAVHCAFAGAVAGRESWRLFAGTITAEALVRVLATAGIALVGASLGGFMLAAASATLVWCALVLVSREARAAFAERSLMSRRRLSATFTAAMGTAAFMAVIMVAFPFVMQLVLPSSLYAQAAPLVLTISLTRAPIMVPLQALQGMLVTHFVKQERIDPRGLMRLLWLFFGAGIVAAALGALIGPPVLRIFGEGYAVNPLAVAALTFAAVLLAALVLVATVLLSRGRHRDYVLVWAAAAVVSVLTLLAPLSLTARVCASLLAGPIAGLAVALWCISRLRAAVAPVDADPTAAATTVL